MRIKEILTRAVAECLLLDHGFGYGVVFSLAGSFHVIAFFVILIAVPAVRPLALET